jgi:hypothetical protein
MKVRPVDPAYHIKPDPQKQIPYRHSPEEENQTNQDKESRPNSKDGLSENVDITV